MALASAIRASGQFIRRRCSWRQWQSPPAVLRGLLQPAERRHLRLGPARGPFAKSHVLPRFDRKVPPRIAGGRPNCRLGRTSIRRYNRSARKSGDPMPFYEYECPHCGYDEEVLQAIKDKPLTKCPSCGKKGLRKLMSAPVFRLKGSGWYETDFKSDKENKRNLAGAEKEDSKSEAKTDAKNDAKTDAKTETKTETTAESPKAEPVKAKQTATKPKPKAPA